MRNFFKTIKDTTKAVKAKVCGFAARMRDRFRMRAAQTRVMLAASGGGKEKSTEYLPPSYIDSKGIQGDKMALYQPNSIRQAKVPRLPNHR